MLGNKEVRDIALLTTYVFLVVGLYMVLFIIFIVLKLLGVNLNINNENDITIFIILGLCYPIGIYFLLLRFKEDIHTEDYPLNKK